MFFSHNKIYFKLISLCFLANSLGHTFQKGGPAFLQLLSTNLFLSGFLITAASVWSGLRFELFADAQEEPGLFKDSQEELLQVFVFCL